LFSQQRWFYQRLTTRLLNQQLKVICFQTQIISKKIPQLPINSQKFKLKNMKKLILTAIAICTVAIVSSSTKHENAKSIANPYVHASVADLRKDVGSAD